MLTPLDLICYTYRKTKWARMCRSSGNSRCNSRLFLQLYLGTAAIGTRRRDHWISQVHCASVHVQVYGGQVSRWDVSVALEKALAFIELVVLSLFSSGCLFL